MVEKLIKLFQSDDANTVHAAAMAISNLSQNGISFSSCIPCLLFIHVLIFQYSQVGQIVVRFWSWQRLEAPRFLC